MTDNGTLCLMHVDLMKPAPAMWAGLNKAISRLMNYLIYDQV